MTRAEVIVSKFYPRRTKDPSLEEIGVSAARFQSTSARSKSRRIFGRDRQRSARTKERERADDAPMLLNPPLIVLMADEIAAP